MYHHRLSKGQDPITPAYVASKKQVEKGGLDHADKAVGRRPHPLFFEKNVPDKS